MQIAEHYVRAPITRVQLWTTLRQFNARSQKYTKQCLTSLDLKLRYLWQLNSSVFDAATAQVLVLLEQMAAHLHFSSVLVN